MYLRLVLHLLLFFLLGSFRMAGQSGDIPEVPTPIPSGLSHSQSIGAHQLWPGLSSEFLLTGNGYRIHQWEAGNFSHADTSVTYLLGRITLGDSYTGISGHATDMASIMIGKSADNDSSGVAYEADIYGFSYVNRWSEMYSEGASGMKLSLHAYASNYGWGWNNGNRFWWGLEEVDSTEDFHFGLYNSESVLWDSLVYENPFNLPVKSAGNLREDTFSGKHYFYNALVDSITDGSNYVIDSGSAGRMADGSLSGYDCLPPGSVGKNILTVGAVDILPNGWNDTSDVVVRPGSSFGPVDDGRIKPDLVAGGDKTSHSAAAVAGAAALLQEHYVKTYSVFPLASTLKALLIHTADEAGENPGPDYKHGWGMVNALRAARHISDTTGLMHIFQDTLAQGDTLLYHYYAEGNELKATLCWTDPEGTPVAFENSPVMLDNPKPMLVNDLDMRLIRRYPQETMEPYVLNASNPSAAAVRGDNAVDNLEQIDNDEVVEGWYTLHISHKASLEGAPQVFSLIISGGRPGIVWDGSSWSPKAPDLSTENYDVLIMEGTSVSIPGPFKARNFIIEPGAYVRIE